MKRIDISTPKYPNTFAIVDDVDYERLNKFKWSALKHRNTFYAVRGIRSPDGKQRKIQMHREILGLESGDPRQTDHQNRNGLHNWRDNLRTCTHSQNKQNSSPHKNSSSAFKGISWHKDRNKWRVRIQINGRLKHLGYFSNEVEAAKTYDKKAKELFGEFAYTNF